MALYLKELALWNESEATALLLTNVSEGVNGSASFGYQTTNDEIKVSANRTQIVATNHSLDVMVIDDESAVATVTAWANDPELNFKAVGFSGDTFLLWDEPTLLTFPRQYDKIVTRKIGMTYKAVSGYAGIQPNVKTPIYAGTNLFALYKCWEGDGNLLNGLQVNGAIGSTVESAGLQEVEIGATDAPYVYSQPLLFPFPTQRLTASMNMVTDLAQGGTLLGLRFLDSAGGEISIATANVSGTGRKSYSAICPALTAYVQWYVRPLGDPADYIQFTTPSIGLEYNASFAT